MSSLGRLDKVTESVEVKTNAGAMHRLMNAVLTVYSYGICLPAIVVLSCLFMLNISLTTMLTNWEVTSYIDDGAKAKLLIVLLVVVLIAVLRRSKAMATLRTLAANDEHFANSKKLLLTIIVLMGILWSMLTQFVPDVDEGRIFKYAYDATQGDFYQFAPGEYMNRHPLNYGVFLLDYVITFLFGGNNYLIFEIINACAVALVFYELNEVGALLGLGRVARLSILASGICFFPVMLYVTMVYGNLLGLAFALAAVRQEMVYFETASIRNAVLCAFAMALSMFFKGTCLIYLVALVVSSLVYPIVAKDARALVLPAFVLIAYFAQSAIARTAVELISGYRMVEPASTLAWIAMGLQETELAPGWWNGYVFDSYYAGGSTSAGQASLAVASINESVQGFCSNPSYAVNFFTRKIASTWSNPTFQCFGTARNGSYVHLPVWVRWPFTYNGQHSVGQYLDVCTTLVYFGALVRVIARRPKRMQFKELTIYMAFIGGFIYLLLSETKARYALLFFVILIPVAIGGIIDLANWIGRLVDCAQSKTRFTGAAKPLRKRIVPVLVLCLSMLLYTLLVAPVCRDLTNHDTPRYERYLAAEDMEADIVNYVGMPNP